jgi:hypothetical protein
MLRLGEVQRQAVTQSLRHLLGKGRARHGVLGRTRCVIRHINVFLMFRVQAIVVKCNYIFNSIAYLGRLRSSLYLSCRDDWYVEL